MIDTPTDYDAFAQEQLPRHLSWRRSWAQRAFVLRYHEQLSDAEIADVLQCSPVPVRGCAHRALQTVRVGLTSELQTDQGGPG